MSRIVFAASCTAASAAFAKLSVEFPMMVTTLATAMASSFVADDCPYPFVSCSTRPILTLAASRCSVRGMAEGPKMIGEFLSELADDPDKLQAYLENPEQVM